MSRDNETTLEKFDRRLLDGLAMTAVMVAVVLLCWAALLVLAQCLGWLKWGQWQPLPLYAIFLSQESQDLSLKMYEARIQPLNFVPALGNANDSAQASSMLASGMLGLQKVVGWLLNLPFSLWLAGGALVMLAAQSWALASRME